MQPVVSVMIAAVVVAQSARDTELVESIGASGLSGPNEKPRRIDVARGYRRSCRGS